MADPSPETPLILALDAALGQCSVAVLAGSRVLAERAEPGGRGQVQRLAPMLRETLVEAGVPPASLDAVAVTIGPGSFTGIRAALALAHGLALGSGAALLGVSVTEALAASLSDLDGPDLQGRALWVAIDSRRGRVFLDTGDGPRAIELDLLPRPDGRVALAGDAALAVATRLAAAGCDVMLTDARHIRARHVAAAGARALAQSGRHGVAVLPLYVDPPEARLPAAGLRPPPAG